MRRPLVVTAAFLAVGLAACGTDGSSLNADEIGVAQAIADSASAWTDDAVGADGPVADAAAAPESAGVELAPGDTFRFPAFWGRQRRANRPSRDRLIVVDGDTARVSLTVTFDGVMRVDTTFDGILDPGTKPLHEKAKQSLLFVRDSSTLRGWRLAGISVRAFSDATPEHRTVVISDVSVEQNSDGGSTLSDPEQLLSPASLTSVSVGDTLAVRVHVRNTTGTDLVPPTQVYIHVRHFLLGSDAWARLPMHRDDDTTFTAHWVVRRPGAALVAVDALDSETLATESGDDYRSNLWAVPVRVQP